MRLITLLLLSILLIPSQLFSKEVSIEDAKNVAKNFFYKQVQQSENLDYKDLNLSVNYIETKTENCFYVFNIDNRDGFIITSAQDFTKPILGYSAKYNVDFSNLSPELRFMLDGYTEQINYGIENNGRPTPEILQKWQNLRIPSTNRTSVTDSQGPLILTNWNQSPYYNDLCPANSSGQNAVVGCVAVAMAQIMKYYNYPAQGTGSKSWYDQEGSVTKYANINYGNQSYAWNNMPIALNGENEDLAKLMYHCGHTVQMDWEVDGSGTQSEYIVTALENYFNYDNTANEYNRQTWGGSYNYTDAQWELMIRNELDALRPIVYSGNSSTSLGAGHAWNCDGYESDGDGAYLYHMNYGWGGYGNGYFALDNLILTAVPGGDDDLFDFGHQIILGMKPEPANYPEHCSGTRTISGFQGLIGDGSGNELYENNINCQTIIQPECARGEVSISFERFDLGEGDYINIHGGPSTDFPIIATLDQNNTPNGNYTSNNDGILLNFITDNTNQGTGWDVKYSSIVCSALTFNEPSGTITDGSGTCDYESGTTCFWYIEPTGASQIILNFTEFDLDVPTHDLLIIYENDFSTPVATYNSSQTPSSNIIINASKAIIRFVSYSSETNVGSGWSVDYTSNSTVSVNELINFDNLVKVYPNPFNENAFIEIGNSNNCNVSLTLTDIVGKTIASKSLGVIGTKQTVSLKDLDIKLTQKGIYLLNVEIDNQVKTYKLISE